MLSDASTVELHRAERSPQPLAVPGPDPEPNTPHAAPTPDHGSPDALTPAADDGPLAPVLCDSPAGVLSRRGPLTLSTEGSAVLERGVGLGPGLGHTAASPDDEAAQTASAPRALAGTGEPIQGLGEGLPERAWASESPDPEDLRPIASAAAGPAQAGAEAEQQDAAGAGKGGHEEALAAGNAPAGPLTACRQRAGTVLGQRLEEVGFGARAPSPTAPCCTAAGAAATAHAPTEAAQGEAGTSQLAEVGAAQPEGAYNARTGAGAAPGAAPDTAAAAVRDCGVATASLSRDLSTTFHKTSDPAIPSLPGEDAPVGGEPVTPPGLLAAMAACAARGGSPSGASGGKEPPEGATEPELPPLDSTGRREVHL